MSGIYPLNQKITRYTQPQYRTKSRYSSTFGPWTNYSKPWVTWEDNKQVTSVNTPGFRKLKRRQLPDHPHTHVLWHQESDYSTCRFVWTWPGNTTAINEYRGPAAIMGVTPDLIPAKDEPDFQSADNLAVGRLFDELSLTKGSAAVTLAEIGKTGEMIAGTAVKLATSFRHLRKGQIQKFSDTLGLSIPKRKQGVLRSRFRQQSKSEGDKLQFAANTWLEYSYGWKPLLSDIHTQAENLANYLTERQFVVRIARGSAKVVKKSRVEASGGAGTWITTREVSYTHRVKYTVKYRLSDDQQSSVANVFGLTNPLIVAWELVPFSFVADWFLPVGNFLESLTATNGLTFAGGVKVDKQRAEVKMVCYADGKSVSDQGATRRWYKDSGGTAFNNISAKNRVVLSAFPSPRLPEFKNPLSVSHATSALALLQSVFHGSSGGSFRVR